LADPEEIFAQIFADNMFDRKSAASQWFKPVFEVPFALRLGDYGSFRGSASILKIRPIKMP